MGVFQLCGDFAFLKEIVDGLFVLRKLRLQDLEGEKSVHHDVTGKIDHPVGAISQYGLQQVAVYFGAEKRFRRVFDVFRSFHENNIMQ
jgi:fumarate reductase subunit D